MDGMGMEKVKGRRKGERDRLLWLWLPNRIKKAKETKFNTSRSFFFHRGKGNKDRNWIKGWKALACMAEIKGRGNEGETRWEIGREVGSSGGLPIWTKPEKVTDYREWMTLHHALSHCQSNTHTHRSDEFNAKWHADKSKMALYHRFLSPLLLSAHIYRHAQWQTHCMNATSFWLWTHGLQLVTLAPGFVPLQLGDGSVLIWLEL